MSCGNNVYGKLGHDDTINRLAFEEIRGVKIEINNDELYLT